MSVSVQEADFDVGAEIAALGAACEDVGAIASFVGLVRVDKVAPEKVDTPRVLMKQLRSKADEQLHSSRRCRIPAGRAGGTASDTSVKAMTLEHYPGMTEAALTAIAGEARARWDLHAVRVIHRVGRLSPGDRIVLVAVASAHRGDAFAACEFIMDYLKTRAPFWKKEERADGGSWVDAREADNAAAARWDERSRNSTRSE